jgi:putative tryptophan/tyrosine transport system substrate-binding protein
MIPLRTEKMAAGGIGRRQFISALGGVAVSWPLAARAQQPVVGYLALRSSGESALLVSAFHQGLKETGYVEGQNLAIEYRWAEGHYDRLPIFAADLVARKVAVIVTGGGNASALAAKNATSTIPVVFETGADPVETHLVVSFARPGGNLTGASILVAGLNPKRFELLSELVPRAGVIALLVNPNYSGVEGIIREVQDAAGAKGVQLAILKATTENEIDVAFATLNQLRSGALVVANDPLFSTQREQLVSLASRYAVPTIYPFREFATTGGLISYGPRLSVVYHLLGTYTGKILAGASPTDLPVQRPTALDLVINLKTAKTLGITVPQTLQVAADEVIE